MKKWQPNGCHFFLLEGLYDETAAYLAYVRILTTSITQEKPKMSGGKRVCFAEILQGLR